VEEKQRGNGNYKMCVKMCEFDESNIQLGTTRYHSILHALP
jgi:hypothetical protein